MNRVGAVVKKLLALGFIAAVVGTLRKSKLDAADAAFPQATRQR